MDARARSFEEVCVEYLACSVGAATVTEWARLSGGRLSHDPITRALAGPAHGARELWARVKPLVRAAEGGLLVRGCSSSTTRSSPSPTVRRANWLGALRLGKRARRHSAMIRTRCQRALIQVAKGVPQ